MNDEGGINSKIPFVSKQIQIQPEQARILNASEQKRKDLELSDRKKKALNLSNHNLIEKARHKVNRAAHNSYKPTKDSQGRNIKEHFSTWKYYVDKNKGDEKIKFYISSECRRLPLQEGIKAAK
jgi:hypothetical protein